jgi:hypothetical protein
LALQDSIRRGCVWTEWLRNEAGDRQPGVFKEGGSLHPSSVRPNSLGRSVALFSFSCIVLQTVIPDISSGHTTHTTPTLGDAATCAARHVLLKTKQVRPHLAWTEGCFTDPRQVGRSFRSRACETCGDPARETHWWTNFHPIGVLRFGMRHGPHGGLFLCQVTPSMLSNGSRHSKPSLLVGRRWLCDTRIVILALDMLPCPAARQSGCRLALCVAGGMPPRSARLTS